MTIYEKRLYEKQIPELLDTLNSLVFKISEQTYVLRDISETLKSLDISNSKTIYTYPQAVDNTKENCT